ncbi:tRNA ligase subunit PheS family protein [Nocardia cyriacigeorgica]|uniref:tRNA ligase subunit PheS family protein n=1 Tax=Nocardia cyriacigeorgica TaxID=135487 RepID=UPI001C499F2A
MLHEGERLERAEFGRIDPEVVRGPGVDPEQWSGLALGMSLDRALTLRKAIPDPLPPSCRPAYRPTPGRRQPSTSWCWS